MFRRTVLALIFLASVFAAQAEAIISMETTNLDQGGLCSLAVQISLRGVSVYINHALAGNAPVSLTKLAPGRYAISLQKHGYYDSVFYLNLAADTKTTVLVTMEQITGFLFVQADPPETTVSAYGKTYPQGSIVLPAGQTTVTLSAFGYEDKTYSVYIPARMTVWLSASLVQAPFTVSDWLLSARSFNPRNGGANGLLEISWAASASGGATSFVYDASGIQVAIIESPPFTQKSQRVFWDGLDEQGMPLSDGSYRIVTETTGYDGAAFSFEGTVRLDSSLFLPPEGSFMGISGSALCPDALSRSTDLLSVGMGAVYSQHSAGAHVVGLLIDMGVRVQSAFDMGVYAIATPDLGLVGGSLRIPLATARTGGATKGLAIVADGRADAGGDSWVRLGPAISFGTPSVYLSVYPALGAHWIPQAELAASLALSLNLAGYYASGSLSASAWTKALDKGFDLQPGISLALDARFFPGQAPIILGLSSGASWTKTGLPSSWSAGLYIRTQL